MHRFVALIVAHPRSSVAVVFAITVALATQIPGLRVNVSPRLLMVGSDPAVAYYENAKERFGSDEMTMIVVRADDVFAPAILESISRLSDGVRDIPEVRRIDSLTTVNNISGEDEWVSIRPLVPGAIPTDPAEVEAIRREALRNPLLVETVVAPDARTAAVIIYSDGDADDAAFNRRFSNQIETVIQEEQRRSGHDIYQIGRPYRQALLAETLVADQEVIWPIGALFIAVVLIFMFRSTYAVLIPMTARVVSIVWAVGFMGLLGYPVTMLSGLIPLLLISVGFTEDVYVVSEFHHWLRRKPNKRAAMQATMDDLATPLLVTSFTTAVGFASLSISDIAVLHQFGVIAPLSFAGSFLVTLLLVPALLQWAPAPADATSRADESSESSRLTAWLIRIGRASVRHRRRTVAVAAIVFCAFASGLPRLVVDNDILGFFHKDSEIRQRAADIHERLAGALLFYVIVDTHRPGGALEPRTLRAVEELQDLLIGIDGVDHTLAISDFLKTVNREMNGGDQRFFEIPASQELASQYLVLLHGDDTDLYIDTSYSAANILVRHDITSTRETAALIERVEEHMRRNFPGLSVTTTAETILTTRAANELSVNMLTGLAATVVIVSIVCSLFFMSIRAGLLSLVPNILPVVVGFGALGFLGIPINVGSALIAAIAVGIAIDDTVHYMARNTVELDRHHSTEMAMVKTLQTEGRAIVATSLALAGAFLVLVLSSFVPLMHFGAASALTIMVALIADLTLTPALMASTRLVTLWNVVGLKLEDDICEIAPLFRGLTRWEARKVVLLGTLREFEADTYVIHKGELSDRAMYMIVTGQVRVMHGGKEGRVLRRLVPGEIFGEMALVDGRERSADVIADVPSEILRLRSTDLDRLRRRFPRTALKVFHNLSTVLSDRLRSLTAEMAADKDGSAGEARDRLLVAGK